MGDAGRGVVAMTQPECIKKGMYWDRAWSLVRGCTKVSEGCLHCWSERESSMRSVHPNEKIKAQYDRLTNVFGRFNGKIRLMENNLELPLRVKKPTTWAAWNDLFHEDVPDEFILATFVAMGLTYKNTGEMEEISPGHKVAIHEPRHTFIILTKRPERMKNLVKRLVSGEPDKVWEEKAHFFAAGLATKNGSPLPGNAIFTFGKWVKDGMPGLWLGVTAENQEQADKRIPILLQIPATVRFVSVEPMLGPIVLRRKAVNDNEIVQAALMGRLDEYSRPIERGIDWIICGGESGPGARPIHPDWARSLRDQCQAAGVPFFFKQWGEWRQVGLCGTEPDDRRYYNKSNVQIVNHEGGQGYHGKGAIYMQRVGKKKAGRILDSRTWDEFPEV